MNKVNNKLMALLEGELRSPSQSNSEIQPVLDFLKSDAPAGTIFNAFKPEEPKVYEKAPKVKDINAYAASILEKEYGEKNIRTTVKHQRRPLSFHLPHPHLPVFGRA